VPWLRTLREFLVANPGDVVVVVIEDYATPEEMAAAYADSRQRVVTFLESGKPGVEWMHPAFATIQETPYTFHLPERFRGRETAALAERFSRKPLTPERSGQRLC
jgi:hypothetical protein